jgi:hypothetical protein
VALPDEVDYPTTYSAMIAQARLSVIANKIYNESLAAHISNAIISEELAQRFEEELRLWRTTLPSYFMDSDLPSSFRGMLILGVLFYPTFNVSRIVRYWLFTLTVMHHE